MTVFSTEHVCLLAATFAFFAVTIFLAAKLNRFGQNLMFLLAAVLGAGGIFFRYALNMDFTGEPNFYVLLVQTMQVCNFNVVLLPLMLVPRFELARQYSVYFSMFAAFTALVSIPASFANSEWSDLSFLNFWFNHVFAVALPLWMMASKRLVPKRRYVIPVAACVIIYFTAVYGISSLLMYLKLPTYGCSFSYVHDPKGVPIITQLYDLIGGPYIHLLPMIPLLMLFFFAFSLPFPQDVKYKKKKEKKSRRAKKENASSSEPEQPYGADQSDVPANYPQPPYQPPYPPQQPPYPPNNYVQHSENNYNGGAYMNGRRR